MSPTTSDCASRLRALRHQPVALRNFLTGMPKGGDIHTHLIGAVHAETYLRWAAADGLFLDESLRLQRSPVRNSIPAASALEDPLLSLRVVDAWSMRNPSDNPRVRQRHFFDAFYKFGEAFVGHAGDALAETMSRAAEQNIRYLELMFDPVPHFGYRGVGSGAAAAAWNMPHLARALTSDPTLGVAVAEHSRRLDDVERVASIALRRGTARPRPGACVLVRYIWEVPRVYPFAVVAALLVEGCLLARTDSRVVGITIDGDESNATAIADYDRHMAFMQSLRSLHPSVGVTLHAGEYSHLFRLSRNYRANHLREAIYTAQTNRIGHGLDLDRDCDRRGILNEMAHRQILVETCLTSNELVLGVSSTEHPLLDYLRADVPVALATDDEGVLRTNLTEQFAIAVEKVGFEYSDLKRSAFASIEHAFLPQQERSLLHNELVKAYIAFEA
jgi:adenosine deaminase